MKFSWLDKFIDGKIKSPVSTMTLADLETAAQKYWNDKQVLLLIQEIGMCWVRLSKSQALAPETK